MSDPNVQECSYLKVDHDFEYTTNDGRQIAIKKDEKLCLIQKTNNDWWKVIRYKEQRSFYVPVTYVTELRRPFLPKKNLGGKQNDERIVAEMSEDHSARRRQIEKWLSNTMSISQGAAGGPESPENTNKLENIGGKEIGSRSEQQKQNIEVADKNDEPTRNKSEKKSLERFRNVVRKLSSGKYGSEDSSLRGGAVKSSQTNDGLETVMENRPAISPKKLVELGQNSFDYQAVARQQVLHGNSQNQRPGMMRSNSTESAGSSNDRRSGNSDSMSVKVDPKAAFNEELSISLQKNNAIKRYSNNSNDRRLVKPNIVEKRPNSPMATGNKTPASSVSASPQSPGIFNHPDNAMKILNDKRKSWAVEELMTELTQIRKERVDDNTSNFVLRSVAIKDRFDPHEKLTQELHDLHTSQHEDSVALRSELKNQHDAGGRRESGELSPSAKAKDAGAGPSTNMKIISQQAAVPAAAECTFDKSKSPKTRISLTNNEACSIQATLNASKSSKRLDEYEEANILNDESRMQTDARDEGSDRKVSLSADKERYLSAYQEHSQLFKSDIDNVENFEKPSYSNVCIKSENEVKIRPELKLKIKSTDIKIKLTPSLEKLASEIQFLPASRTSVIDNDRQQSPLTKNHSLPNADQNQKHSPASKESSFDYNNEDLINVSQDREMWKNFKSKLNYKTSFKSKQEEKTQVATKDVSFDEDPLKDFTRPTKTKLKKSATFNCVAVPEYYKHFQRHHDSRRDFMRRAKRRSRSLEDIRLLVNMELKATLKASGRSEAMKKNAVNSVKPDLSDGKSASKPIPAPRTVESAKNTQGKIDEGLSGSYKGPKPYFPVLPPPSISKSYENLSQDFTNLKVFDANKSTAVSFKNLLCTSDSGSDEYLHYKAFPKSSASKNEHPAFSSDSKINNKPILSSESLPLIDRSISDEQILSSNISSEALFSQSESEAYPISELSNNSSPVTIERDRDNFVSLPPGWTQEYDAQSKQICFVNVRGEKWFSSNDAEGKIYFFEENSNESSWLLPTVTITEPILRNMQEKSQDVELRSSGGSEKFRIGKARSLVVPNQRISKKERRSGSVSHDWPQLFDGNMCILKEGTLQRAKITENGKRLRKHWNTSYVVLSELFLLFFKDAKSFSAMKSGQSSAAKPDISVDLNGATVQLDEKASSRKNVYMIGTILGLQVLIQSDNPTLANEWYLGIQDVINKLPSCAEAQTNLVPPILEQPRDVKSKLYLSVNSPEETRAASKIGRSRSMKIKKIEGSNEDLSGSSTERQTKIKAKLKRFFQRRPTMDSLVKNGIYKDEPAFGSYLKDVCTRQPPIVPQFVKDCIKILERNPENMKADGLYRASGNLSQIQKIRLQVDQNNLNVLEQEEDVHVLTGALKLFFRELKEPLIPYEFFEKALKGSMLKKRSDRIQIFREIVKGLTQPHYDTLKFLLQHLLRVTMFQEYNRMHIPNLAIVFGPTLMWPAEESANMALDLMQQNLVIECLLSEYDKIFQ